MVRLKERTSGEVSMSLIRCEWRVLRVAMGAVVLAVLLWTVAISTDMWIYVAASDPAGIYINGSGSFFRHSRTGIWRICRTELSGSGSEIETCHYHNMFPSNEDISNDPEVDVTSLDHTRSAMAFSLISFSLMMMALGFSAYTFKETRYMFKRLAAGIHFLSACTILVVQEVLINSVKHNKSHLHNLHPPGTIFSYGSSFHLGWTCFALQLGAGTSFLLCSRKRKANLAPTEELGRQDEPQILGRI